MGVDYQPYEDIFGRDDRQPSAADAEAASTETSEPTAEEGADEVEPQPEGGGNEAGRDVQSE
jgi:hypothetical protein